MSHTLLTLQNLIQQFIYYTPYNITWISNIFIEFKMTILHGLINKSKSKIWRIEFNDLQKNNKVLTVIQVNTLPQCIYLTSSFTLNWHIALDRSWLMTHPHNPIRTHIVGRRRSYQSRKTPRRFPQRNQDHLLYALLQRCSATETESSLEYHLALLACSL